MVGTDLFIADHLVSKTSQNLEPGTVRAGDFGPLTEVFREQPPTLEEFVTGAGYLNNPPLSPIQYEAVRHLEQIFYPETYALMEEVFGDYWKPVRYVNFAYLEWGKGSGKDHVCRIAVARVVHLLMCLKSPQDYYGMPGQDTIHILNVAASSTQAHRAFFVPLKGMVRRAPCFKGVYEEKEFSLMFSNQVECVSGHSMMETLEGLNILVGLADEISAFKTKDEIEATSRQIGGREPAKSAESIMRVLRTSARTRFPRTFKVAAISYPRFKGDAIQQLRRTAEEDIETRGEGNSRMYASGPHATWDVNPRIETKEDFREDYDEDPEMARAMYECKPEISMRRFMRNTEAIYAALGEKPLVPPLVVNYRWGRTDREEIDPDTMLAPADHDSWQAEFLFSPDLVPIQGAAYALHADMAISGDSAGIAMAHVRRWREGEWDSPMGEVLEMRPLVRVDFVTSLDAELKATPQPRDIQIRWFRKLVWELTAKGFYVASVTMDNFQSADTLQILLSRGIEADKLSTDRNNLAYNNLKDVMYDGRLEGYWDEILVNELMGLTLLPNGKIDHPPGGSKDRADALAGAVLGAVMVGGDEGEEPVRADEGGVNWFSVGSGSRNENFDLELDWESNGFTREDFLRPPE